MMKAIFKSFAAKAAPVLILTALSFTRAMAQGGPPQQMEPGQVPPQQQQQQQGNLLRQLNLTPDQVERIRAINEQGRDERRAVGDRLHDAQRALDEAIYQDNVDENLIEERVRELAAAQAAAARMRAMTELRIRRVLTADQLNTFRRLREQVIMEERERRVEDRRAERQFERQQRRPGGPIQGGPGPVQQGAPPAQSRPDRPFRRP